MIASTKGIVLRQIKYGDTSVVCTMFTERFGLQSYMIKGIRTSKKTRLKGNLLQYGNILDITIYHHPGKNLQFIKEFTPAYFFEDIGENVVKNTIVLFAVEVLSQLLLQDQQQEDVFCFTEDFLIKTDKANIGDLANYPLYFIKQVAELLGYSLANNFGNQQPFLNVYEGAFSANPSPMPPQFDADESKEIHDFLKIKTIEEVHQQPLSPALRTALLDGFIIFLQNHAEQFKTLKSLPILHTILH